MTEQLDVRQDKAYRRGLILGFTAAEVMILLLFALLMALGTVLENRDRQIEALDEQIEALDEGGASRLVEAIQREFPQARDNDDFYKELVQSIKVRKIVEQKGKNAARDVLLADAEIGRDVRQAAERAGVQNPREFAKTLAADANRSKRGEWPPFINLSEAGGYFFDSGKAMLRPEFEANLKAQVIPMLARNLTDYDVNVIEVIGHTDEVPVKGSSNLDAQLILASHGRYPIADLRSTDNAGLAIARAVAVVRVLRADPRLRKVSILPLSGAQMIVPIDRTADGTATSGDQRRRRMEIRLRRTTSEAAPQLKAN